MHCDSLHSYCITVHQLSPLNANLLVRLWNFGGSIIELYNGHYWPLKSLLLLLEVFQAAPGYTLQCICCTGKVSALKLYSGSVAGWQRQGDIFVCQIIRWTSVIPPFSPVHFCHVQIVLNLLAYPFVIFVGHLPLIYAFQHFSVCFALWLLFPLAMDMLFLAFSLPPSFKKHWKMCLKTFWVRYLIQEDDEGFNI